MQTRSVLLVDRYPDTDRFDAITSGLLTSLVGLAFAFLVVNLTSAPDPIAVALLLSSLIPGAVIVGRWLTRQRTDRVVYLRSLAPGWVPTVRAMAGDLNVVCNLIDKTPPGAIFDHLCDVHRAATDVLTRCVARAESALPESTPDADVMADRVELDHLVTACQRMRAAHETVLLRRPITELTERTDQLTDVLEHEGTTTRATDTKLSQRSSTFRT